MITKEVVEEFLEETSHILVELAASTAQTADAATCRDALKSVERGLHTIAGNAAAFGHMEFADAARQVLEWVRSVRPTGGKSVESPQDTSSVLEFVERSRQFIDLIRDGDPPSRAYFSDIIEAHRRRLQERSAPRQEAGANSARSSGRSALESEAERILAQAPPVRPRIDNMIRMAMQKLQQNESRTTAAAPVPETITGGERRDAAPAAGQEPPRRSTASGETAPRRADPALGRGRPASPPGDASFPHGFAFEAAVTADSILNLARKCKPDQHIGALFSRVAQILSTFSQWSAGVRSLSLADCLKDVAAWVEKRGASAAVEVVPPADSDVHMARGTGALVRELLKEVLHACLPEAPGKARAGEAVRIVVQTTSEQVHLRMAGAADAQRARAALRLGLLEQRLDGSGVGIARENGRDIVVAVPQRLDSIEALLVTAGGSRLAIPRHRVLSAAPPGAPGPSGAAQPDVEALGGSLPRILDLSGPGTAGGGAEKAPAAAGLVMVRTEKGRHAVKVDQILDATEVVVLKPRDADMENAATVPCMDICGLSRLSLLWAFAALFESADGTATTR